MTDLQKLLHAEIEKAGKYGIQDEYNAGYIDGVAWALHQLIKQDGENRTGCESYDRSEVAS